MSRRPRPSDETRRALRLRRRTAPSLKTWTGGEAGPLDAALPSEVAVDCGWGRLLFGQTFDSPERLAAALAEEAPGKRDIAIYIRDPHVVLAVAPQELFLDPSHTFRLWLEEYQPSRDRPQGFAIHRLRRRSDLVPINRILQQRRMVPIDPDFFETVVLGRSHVMLIAVSESTGDIIGTVMGVDHVEAFGDPEGGASLWCLAVDAQAPHPGVGEALVRHLLERMAARGRAFVDLSVMHDNAEAIALYEALGFRRVPVFCVKTRSSFNEPLFVGPQPEARLNPYAEIIVREARRRGIAVEVLDAEAGYFRLSFGGRQIVCRESLSELTTAVAMSVCDDKAVTRRWLARAGIAVPDQIEVGERADLREFLARHGRIVVKPARGEQGAAVSVGVEAEAEAEAAVEAARRVCDRVLAEQLVEGEDLRVIVIGGRVVAAAVRRPPVVEGNGRDSVRRLIARASRRREAATGGESRIPVDAETERCVRASGLGLDDVPPTGTRIAVRRTANLHTGGTIEDVTPHLDPALARASEEAAAALAIPVVGLDLIVPSVAGPDYVVIEANERPGLANHEPQPTAERFIDLLFPQTAS